MKKTVLSLGMALVMFTTVTMATPTSSSHNPTTNTLEVRIGTPLCTAISKGDVAVVRKMIEYGANVNEKSNGMTPLMVAARYNNVEIIKILLDSGADVTTKNENGFTALKFAQLSNASEAIAFLSPLGK